MAVLAFGGERITLREYQREALDKIEKARVRGVTRQLGVAACGLGKTIIFANLAERMKVPTLILAHRDELIQQAADKVRMVWPDVDLGIVKAERNELHAGVVVASVQTLASERRLRQIPMDRFGLVIVDECFPAGTLVGDRRIEEVRAGDFVPSFDEKSGRVVSRRVVRTMSRPARSLVRLVLADGNTLTCTPEHPLWTPQGWVPASQCHTVAVTYGREQVPDLLSTDATESSHVFQGLPLPIGSATTGRQAARPDRQTAPGNLLVVPATDGDRRQGTVGPASVAQGRPGLLRPGVSGSLGEPELVRDDGAHQPGARVQADGGAQPDGGPGRSRPNDGFAAGQRLAFVRGAWRKWSSSHRGRIAAVVRSRVADKRDRANTDAQGLGIPDPLQAGRGRPDHEDRRRGRRSQSWDGRTTLTGREERDVPRWTRVVSVEVHEQGSDRRFGGLCPDGQVYNLEVEGTHTYVADGVVAHNCHHVRAASYARILDRLGCGPERRSPNVLLLGVTATADRGDGKGLDKAFDEVVWSYDILWGIRSGYLADLKGVQVKMDVDLAGVRTTGGDYNEGELGKRMEAADAPTHVAAAWQAHAAGRPTLVFTPTVALATETAAEFVARGISAAVVTGADNIDDRRRVLREFSAGRIQVIANCGVLTEGTDLPSVSCVVMARPTKSRALYVQCVGRGTRRHPDKDHALILDVVGATAQHDLMTIPSLFGVDKKAFERGERTISEVVEEKEQADIASGKLVAEDVELFRKLKESKRIAWVRTAGSYAIGLDGRRSLVLSRSGEDWTATVLHPSDPPRVLMADTTLEMAQGIAEDFIRRSGAAALARPNASWRSRPPSPAQLNAAKKWHIKVDPTWNAGQLSQAMDEKIAAVRIRNMAKGKTG